MKSLGILGCGNMGTALTISAARTHQELKIYLYDIDTEKSAALANKTWGEVCSDIESLFVNSEAILIALKPDILLQVIRGHRCNDKLFISIAAGISLSALKNANPASRWIRVMPNAPVLINSGVLVWAAEESVTQEDASFFSALFKGSGKLFKMQEKLLDTVTGLSGSGPAYIFLIINALAEGAVLDGMSKDQALQIAALTVEGAAKMVTTTDIHPEILKDRTTSPGGTTAAGLWVLEKNGVRGSLIETVQTAARRSRELGQ